MIGSLMYPTNTRPDIFFAMNTLSQLLIDPRHIHLIDASSEMVDATMRRQMIGSLRYLTNTIPDTCFAVNTLRNVHLMVAKGIVEYGLKYDTNQNINLEGHVDSDWEVPSIGRTLQSVASIWDQV